MKIYFEVPYGYRTPDISGEEVSVIPPRGSFMDVIREQHFAMPFPSISLSELQVRKVCFNSDYTKATVTLAEED